MSLPLRDALVRCPGHDAQGCSSLIDSVALKLCFRCRPLAALLTVQSPAGGVARPRRGDRPGVLRSRPASIPAAKDLP